jgi:hypothetical protein
MFIECRHIPTSGQKCKSPQVRNTGFCYFHRNTRQRAQVPSPLTPFILPFIEDSRGVLIAINEVFRAMGENRISRSEASTYFNGIQIAARVIARIEKTVWEPVRALEYDNDGIEQGEQKTACEPLLDCVKCDRQDICEARKAALEHMPENYDDLLAGVRNMTPEQTLARWDARQKAEDQRMRNLRSLAVQDNYVEPITLQPPPPYPSSY